MNILILVQCYAPEDVSGSVLVRELATDLVKIGHSVTIITVAPNYPYGRVYPGYKNRILQKEWIEGVKVVRIWSFISPKKTFWRRIFHYGTFSVSAFYGGLFCPKPDIIVCFSPPLPLCLTAWLLSSLWRIPWLLQLEDIYPDAAVNTNILRNQAVINFFSFVERFVYKRATHISVICDSFKKNLLNKGVPPQKITVIPVWSDSEVVKPLPRENAFRKQHQLIGKFVVMYSGNLGITSCLEDVILAAALLKDCIDIRFVIIGEGIKKNVLIEMAQQKGLSNVIFLPYQSRELFPEMLAAADVGLVTLNEQSHLSSLPSKIFNIMASARPVIAVAPQGSEIVNLVDNTQCGITILPGRPDLLATAIKSLCYADPFVLEEMGKKGRIELETNFTRVKCVKQFEQMITSLLINR